MRRRVVEMGSVVFFGCATVCARTATATYVTTPTLSLSLQVLAPAQRTQGPEILPSSVKNVLPQSVKCYLRDDPDSLFVIGGLLVDIHVNVRKDDRCAGQLA
jgi:hypothetical protein